MKSFLSILVLVTLAGCYTQQKAADQMDKAHNRYELIAAGKCANWYPVRIDTVAGETKYLPGIPMEVPGPTVYVNCDSIKANPGNTNTSKVPADCPPSTLRVDTVFKPYYITKENTAAKRALELKLQKSEKSSETKNGFIWALAILLALSVIINIIQFIIKRKS